MSCSGDCKACGGCSCARSLELTIPEIRFLEMLGQIRTLRSGGGRGAKFAHVDLSTVKDPKMRRYIEDMREETPRELSVHKVELNKRFVFAMASLCFVLIGIPLGIRSQRKESTIGMAISLAVSLGYYVIVILMLSCEELYAIHPEILIWIPVAVCLAISAHLVRKHL